MEEIDKGLNLTKEATKVYGEDVNLGVMSSKDLMMDEENRNVEYLRYRMGEYVQVSLLQQPQQQHIDLAFDICELLSFADIDGRMD